MRLRAKAMQEAADVAVSVVRLVVGHGCGGGAWRDREGTATCGAGRNVSERVLVRRQEASAAVGGVWPRARATGRDATVGAAAAVRAIGGFGRWAGEAQHVTAAQGSLKKKNC